MTRKIVNRSTFLTKVLSDIFNATWYIRNADLHRHLKIEMVTAEIRRFVRKHDESLLHHDNVERSKYSTTVSHNAGLREQPHLSCYHYHKTPNMRQYNTPTQLPIVPGKLIHVASAIITVSTGSMKRKHTNWTG